MGAAELDLTALYHLGPLAGKLHRETATRTRAVCRESEFWRDPLAFHQEANHESSSRLLPEERPLQMTLLRMSSRNEESQIAAPWGSLAVRSATLLGLVAVECGVTRVLAELSIASD